MNNLSRRDFIKAAGLVMLTSASTGCGSSSIWPYDYTKTIYDTREFIKARMAKDAVPGLSIALVDGSRVVWTEGFGVKQINSASKVDGDTIFEIGSISKTFTAFMIMQLVSEGRINLDAPITNYIKDFRMPPAMGKYGSGGGEVTVRSMMTHHSGIPGDLLNGAFSSVYYPDYNKRLINIVSQTNATAPVNFKMNYSNTAISLLADVIESASGMSFREYSTQFIKKIGMADSSFFRDDIVVKERIAQGHWEGKSVGTIYVNIPASGSILASANDMAEYLKMVIARGKACGRQLLREEYFNQMMTPQNNEVALDYDFSVGLIWMLSDPQMQGAGNIWWHNGSTNTFNSHLEILAEHGLGVVVLGNSDTAGSIVADAARFALRSAFEVKTGRSISIPAPVFSPIIVKSEDELKSLAGVYVFQGGYLKVTALNNALKITAVTSSDNVSKTVVPRANGYFSESDSQNTQYAFPVVSGRRIVMKFESNSRSAFAERYDPVAIPEAWSSRIGSYRMINADPNDALIKLAGEKYLKVLLYTEEGMLLALINGEISVFEPLNNFMCLMRGFGRGQGSTLRVVSYGSSETLWYFDMQYSRVSKDIEILTVLK